VNVPQRLGESRIDARVPLHFTFNGRRYQGCKGDTLASALLANGVDVVARSWKYHRPRGIYSCGVEEPNAIVQLETGAFAVPNARATEVELYEGLVARSVNCWPSVEHDFMAVTGVLSRLLPAGFYYKTFMWPKRLWPRYEHYIRKASGFGSAPDVPDVDRYDKMNVHCDVLVVGGGPAGLSAALAAGRTGARVIIADQQVEFGGELLNIRETAPVRDWTASLPGVVASSTTEWLRSVIAELAAMPDVRILTRSTVFGYHDHNFLTINQRLTDHLPPGERRGFRERVWCVRAKQVVLATGAIERPIVFGNNDRPGVMLASAVSAFVNRYGVELASRAIVFTNNDAAYRTAMDLLHAGIVVSAIVDARSTVDNEWAQRVRKMQVPVIENAVVMDVKGRKRVSAVTVMSLDHNGESVSGAARMIECDLLAVSGGFSPAVHLHAQSGGKPRFDESKACFVPGTAEQDECSVGACNGVFSTNRCIAEGFAAGTVAAQRVRFMSPTGAAAVDAATGAIRPLWIVPSQQPNGRGPKQFVDMQNDVTASDIVLAAREGYRSIEHVKRYTTLGFGTDQGKLGNINGMAILARALGNDIASTGTTTFRPNYTPVSFGAIAGPDLGDLFEPIRKTALHEWHAEHGALFENVGQWKRPWYYPRLGESMHDAVNRECLAARNGVGIMDASTLGKIDIEGPDATVLLNWVYTNAWSKLGIGRSRYGLMLDENGMVMDDGVTTRLGENHFLMTTTTGGAARVMAWLERWLQTEWPHLKVYLTSVTDHWATAAVAGPKSRKVLQAVCPDIDFSPEAFPFMSCREGTVSGVPARVVRISFSGELAYEVNVSANTARHVWEALMKAGESHGITPYGTETMHVLRAEKGFIIVGQDTDGSVTPLDLGMEWIVAKGKDFIGRRSLLRSDTSRADRKQLVGLLAEQPREVLPEGSQILEDTKSPGAARMQGHVTSSYFSACLDRSIALALVRSGGKRTDEIVRVSVADGRVTKAKIVRPAFIDPEGARQNV
jgi:sarcosine oxidase, subunit alpha